MDTELVHAEALWEALGFLTLGVVTGFIGVFLRREYHRSYTDNPRATDDPAYPLAESLMRRGAVIFLTTGAMMVLVGLAIAGIEGLRFLRGG